MATSTHKDSKKTLYSLYHAVVIIALVFLLFMHVFKSDKIAYVDSAKLLNEFKGSQKAKKAFDEKAKVWQNNIDTLTAGIQESIKKYEKELATLSVKEQNLTKQIIANQQKELADYQQAIQQNAQEENGKLTQDVISQINAFLLKYGKAHNYKMILIANQSGTIAYAREGLDITSEVIEELNKEPGNSK